MKKLGSLLLIVCLLVGSAVPVFAQETNSKGLETAILAVKKVVDIPGEYQDFDYSSNEYEQDGKKISSWYLSWGNPEEYRWIHAVVEQGEYLTSYSKYNKEMQEGLGNITREMGEKTASAFLGKARPDLAGKMKSTGVNGYADDTHRYQFVFFEEDVPVPFISANIEVDRHTGEVTSYDFNFNEKQPQFPIKGEHLSLEEGRKAYEEKLGPKLSYRSTYDWKTKQLHIFPAYSADHLGKVIDAKSGDPIDLYNQNDNYRYYAANESKAKDSGAGLGGLSYEEIQAVDSVSSVISKEKAESRLRSLVPDISSEMKVANTSLVKNAINGDQYLWEIGFDHAYGIIDAKTEELVSFYHYEESGGEKDKANLQLSEVKAKEKAEAFIKKVAGAKLAQCLYQEQQSNLLVEKSLSSAKLDENANDTYRFSYVRQVNDIDFSANYITVSVNGKNGKITQYDCQWYTTLQCPTLDNAITREKAFALFDEAGKIALHYERNQEGKVVLVYAFKEPVNNFVLDAYTGTKLDWRGEPYKDHSMPIYQDLAGHWVEAVVNSLLENGYYLPGDAFHPNEKITQIQFLRYLYSPVESYYTDEELYRMMTESKVIKKEERSPDAQVTRQDAAKFAIRFLGLQKAAEKPEIFTNPYSDQVDKSYGGYAALAYGLGIMKGDAKGRFNGQNAVTNAESAMIVYQILQVK